MPSAEFEAGQVCYQSIPVGTSVPADTVINLQVSTGPDTGAPTESETPAESVSPEPTAQPTAKRKDVVVPLPDDRETVYVRITVGGVEQIPSQPVDTRIRQARFTLEGTGTQQIVVYIDEVQTQSYALNFDE